VSLEIVLRLYIVAAREFGKRRVLRRAVGSREASFCCAGLRSTADAMRSLGVVGRRCLARAGDALRVVNQFPPNGACRREDVYISRLQPTTSAPVHTPPLYGFPAGAGRAGS
jgi:hypothetical protein